MCGNFGGFLLETFQDKQILYFDDAQYDMENSFFALAPKCSRNVAEDHLIFKSHYIYDILAQKFDPQGGGVHTNPPGHSVPRQEKPKNKFFCRNLLLV